MKVFNTHITFILLAALTLCLGGCGNRQLRERFDTVERVVTDRPDSALALLREIPDPSRLGTADRARYDLLMAEARYMADSIDTVPTRLLEAAACFDSKGDTHNAARAYYYAGIQTRQKGDYGKAIICFLKAGKRAGEKETPLFIGKINRSLADCYASVDDWQSALHYHKISYDSFREAGEYRYYENALYDVACGFFATRQYDSCLLYAGSLRDHALRNGDSINMLPYALSLQGRSYLEKGMYPEAIGKFEEMRRTDPRDMEAEDYMHLGMAYLRNGEVEKACEANRHALAMDPGMVELDFYIANATGDTRHAADALGLITTGQANEIDSLLRRKYNVLISEYHTMEEREASRRIEEGRKERIILSGLFLSALVAVALGGYILVRRIRRQRLNDRILADALRTDLARMKEALDTKEAEMTRTSCRLAEMSSEMRRKDGETAKLESDIGDIISGYILSLNAIGKNTSGAAAGSGVVKRAKDSTIRFFSNPATRRMLTDAANRTNHDVMDRFGKDFPGTSENVTVLFLCHVLGMSAPTIGMVLGIDTDAVYRRKYKLRLRIERSEIPDKPDYLSFL